MLANGSDWSSLVRTTSHGCGPIGRRGISFMATSLVFRNSLRATADRHLAAGGLDRLLGELDVGDLLDRRLLGRVDVAVGDAVLDRPFGARGVEAAVHRPHAVL